VMIGGTGSFQADEIIVRPGGATMGSAARHILHAVLLAGEQAVILAGQEMTREPVARWPG
jgi:hypothetical protein